MKHTLRPLLAALMAAGCAAAHGQVLPDLRFSGFGTLGIVHSGERNADFVSTIFQKNGAGLKDAWSFNPDTKIGAQVDAVFNDSFSAVVQLVAQHRYDNSYMPEVEWANVKWQATPELSIRVGRIASPNFLISETRFVGYAQPWIRPPLEVYNTLPITRNDGVDVSYDHSWGSVKHSLHAYYGRSSVKLTGGSPIKSSPTWGISDTMQSGDLTLRAGYNFQNNDVQIAAIDGLLRGINSFSAVPGPIGANAAALSAKYAMHDLRLGAFSLAAQYDPGKWFAMAEVVQLHGDGPLANSRNWYVAGGVRLGAFTPYAIYASARPQVPNEPGVPLPAAAGLNAGLNSLIKKFNPVQSTASLGLRWDFMKNTALKVQYDHINTGANSSGRLNATPAFQTGSSVNVFSAALDFVF